MVSFKVSLSLLVESYLLLYVYFCSECVSDAAPSAVASFSDVRCEAGGVCPHDPLTFTCEVNEVATLGVTLPNSPRQSLISATDFTPIDGIALVSLDVTTMATTRNFVLTLSIASASVLASGNITCDDTFDVTVAMAGCPVLDPLPPRPEAPLDLRQMNSSNTATTATISWDSAGDDVTYTVTSSSLSSPVTGIEDLSYTLTDLTVDTDYTVSVTATNECGDESPPANITVRIDRPPSAPPTSSPTTPVSGTTSDEPTSSEPLPITFLDPLIGCDDEMRTPVTVSWTIDSNTTNTTTVSVLYTDPTTGRNVTACTGLSGQQKNCSFSVQLSDDVSVIRVFVTAPGFPAAATEFLTAALIVEYFLDRSSPPLGLRASLNPLCDDSDITSLSVQGLFGIKTSPDTECTYIQTSSEDFTDSETVFIELDLVLESEDYNYCATAILNGREKTDVDDILSLTRDEECDSDGQSTGAAAGIAVVVTLLVVLPVGVVLGCCGMWCMMRYRGATACFSGGGGQQKVRQLQAAIYEEPSQVETAIPLTDNQAYGPVNMHNRNL